MVLIITLLFPFNAKANEKFPHTIVSYNQTYLLALETENVFHKPSGEVVEKLAQEHAQRQTLARAKRASYARPLQCVEYAKRIIGVFGTWGDGGRYLSLNSTGEINDVVIFYRMHVAVVIGRVGEILTITEANYDYRGSIRTRTINVNDSSIKGFHKF